jgi:ribonuclease-3
MATAAAMGAGLDWKTSLQELGARTGTGVPSYEVTATGPDHAKHFAAVVKVGESVAGEGIGPSKKVAEQMAAASAYEALLAAHPEHAAG